MLLFIGICRKHIPRCESCGTLETTGHVSDDLLKDPLWWSNVLLVFYMSTKPVFTNITDYNLLKKCASWGKKNSNETLGEFLWQRFYKVQVCWLQPQRSRPDIFTKDNKPEVCFRKMETARVTVAQYHETDEAKHECLEQLRCRGRQWSW